MAKLMCGTLRWDVTYHDCNADKIVQYNILKYKEAFIKKLKKQCVTKEEFAEKLRCDLMWHYWSKAEWELVIEIDENNRVWLNPWVGSRDPEGVRIDVTADERFDWRGFAEEHIGKQIYKTSAKVDVFDQLTFKDRFEKLVDYLWYTRLKYERYNPKFDR